MRASIDLRQMLRKTARDHLGGFGESLFDTAYQVFREAAQPTEPFAQQDSDCGKCAIPIYLSANGILLCLQCGQRYGAVYVDAPSAYAPPNVYQTRRRVDRTFRVKTNKTRQRPAPPARPVDGLASAYTLLGLPRTATADDVKRRRKELALTHHGDVGGSDAKMAEINAAADLLLASLP